MRQTRWILTAFFVILWTVSLIGVYFWAHRPFDGAFLGAIGSVIAGIVAWLAITCLGMALGRRVTHQTLADEPPFVRLALASGIGLGLISLLVGILGLLGLLNAFALLGLIFVLVVVLWRDVVAVIRDGRLLTLPRPGSRLQKWFRNYSLVTLTLTFVSALTPPTAWDALVYHITGPRLFREAGRIVHNIDLPYLGFPQLGEMQFLFGMALGGDTTIALFHFGYGILALATTVALARRIFDESTAWFAAVLLLSVPTLLGLMTSPYVDATLLFYATASIYAFVRWQEKQEQGWLTIMGLLCGLSVGVKYTAVLIPIALALCVGWELRHKLSEDISAWFKPLVTLTIITTATSLFWLIENWLTTGNPIYPFFLDNGVFWDAWRGWWYDRPGTGLATTAPWRLMTAPFEATVLGTSGTEFFDATIGPLLLLSAGLLPFVWRTFSPTARKLTGYLLFFFALNYLLWLVGLARTALLLQTRLLIPMFGIVAVLGGSALARLPELRRPQLDVNWMVLVFFNLTLGFLLLSQVMTFVQLNPLPVIIGTETRLRFEGRQLGIYPTVIDDLNNLGQEATIQFLWEPRSYACSVDCRPDALLDHFLHHTQANELDANGIVAAWQEMEVTHVLLNETGLGFIMEAEFDPVTDVDLAILTTLQNEHLTPVQSWADQYTLYELNR